ncbi:mechanosensitive ion channel family protein [Pseudanabaena sp. PCC 6802]|uniref:mechanosensitive ion channel family protein n=1 Tax=Pseudanabaena sp. PCC 6802 TaxID=118173 RepID=UPI00034C27A6|nr:mechanosensitive ion channel family protein [Pseudanabaena sp. PCC 6802]
MKVTKTIEVFVALALAVFLCLIAAPLAFPQTSPSSQPPTGAVVTLDDKPLFAIEKKALSSSPEKRAQTMKERITTFADDRSISIDSLWTKNIEDSILVGAGDKILIYVSDEDAKVVGKSRQELANEYSQIIREAVRQYREDRSTRSLWLAAIYAVGTTIALIGAIVIWRWKRVTFRINAWLNSERHNRIPSIQFQNFELLSADRITDLCIWLVGLIRSIALLTLLYVYFSFVFSLFPATKHVGATLFSYVDSRLQAAWNAFLAYLPSLLTIVLVAFITYHVLRFLKFIFTAIGKQQLTVPGFYPEWAAPTYKLLTYLIIAMAFAVIFPYIPGSNSASFQGISIFLGVLISIGSSTAVANIVAGIITIYTRAFQIGDRVKIGDIVGDVEAKLLLVTRIRTVNNVLVTLPNSTLLTSNIVNYSALIRDDHAPLILHTTVTLGYDAPWRKIHETLIAAARATTHILDEPSPFVLQTALNDFYVSYELKAYTNHPSKMASIYSELHQNIQDKCNEVGIEICSPHYSALRDGNHNTIPETYLPEGYQAPGFKIDNRSD